MEGFSLQNKDDGFLISSNKFAVTTMDAYQQIRGVPFIHQRICDNIIITFKTL